MSGSNRFAVAVHVLALMAENGGEPVKSETLAESVKTNPVVIRRILCELSRAELVVSQKGAAGGSRLTRDPADITLLDVYRAVEPKQVFCVNRHKSRQGTSCVAAEGTETVLREVLSEINQAVEGVLSRRTMADVAHRSRRFDPVEMAVRTGRHTF